jgi:protein-tyrosine phosphatase
MAPAPEPDAPDARPARDRGGAPRVLFVCTGNLCRSPLAAGLLEVALAARPALGVWLIDAAGTHARPGMPPPALAIREAERYGAAIAARRSRALVPDDFQRFTHLYAMDRGHLDYLRAVAPVAFDGCIGLLPAAGGGGVEVPDPYGGGAADYRRAARLIAEGIRVLLERGVPRADRAPLTVPDR